MLNNEILRQLAINAVLPIKAKHGLELNADISNCAIILHTGPWQPTWVEADRMARELNEAGLDSKYNVAASPSVEERGWFAIVINWSRPEVRRALEALQAEADSAHA